MGERVLRGIVGWVLCTHRTGTRTRGFQPANGGCRAPTLRKAIVVLCLGLVVATAFPISACAQDVMGLFRLDPIQFFSSVRGGTWVGNGRYFMVNYSDTLVLTPDSSGRVLLIRRVLVNNDDTLIVSRGRGQVAVEPGDSTLALRWSEHRYPEVTGRLRWQEGQWVISFDGSWSAWSIRVRYDSPFAVVAAAARSLGAFPPVELTTMTYRARPTR